jgi:hypothetical protein
MQKIAETLNRDNKKIPHMGEQSISQPSLGVIGNIGFPSIRDKEELIIPPFTWTSSPRFRQ